MFRPPIALGALLVAPVALPGSGAQDSPSKVDCKVYWSAEPRPVRPVPTPLIPEHWLVVPREANASVAQVFMRHLLDPGSPMPSADGSGLPWKSTESKHPAGLVAAFTRITSERDEVRMARLPGAELLFVNGDGFVGDVEARGFRGVPVALRKGENDLYVLGIPDSFELELWCPQTRTVLGAWDVAWPTQPSLSDDLAFPVFNASLAPVDGLHVHYGHARVEGGSCEVGITDWRDGGRMLPLGLRIGATYFLGMDECDPFSMAQPIVVPLCVYSCGDDSPDGQILRWPGKSTPLARQGMRSNMPLLGSPMLRVNPSPLFIHGSGTTLARARFDQECVWYRAGHVPEALGAEEFQALPPESRPDTVDWFTRESVKRSRYVLYGNEDTNKSWSRLVPQSSPILVNDGRLRINDRVYEGNDICGWFVLKGLSHEVVVIADTGARGARLGYMVQPLLSEGGDLDYCFWDARGPDGTPREFASGTFPSASGEKRGR